jgi:hypothetical protein
VGVLVVGHACLSEAFSLSAAPCERPNLRVKAPMPR